MKKFYFLLVFLCFLGVGISYAQYTSYSDVSGDYSATSGIWNGTLPPANGTLTSAVIISSGAEITRTGNIDARGNTLIAGTRYSGKVFGTLVVEGDFTHNNGAFFSVYSGGVLEVYGDFSANNEVRVYEGGMLIVHGNLLLDDMGNGQHDLDGTVLVSGDAVIKDFDMTATAIVVVGGDLTADGNQWTTVNPSADIYVVNPDATVTDNTSGGQVNEGDAEDFLADQAENTDLTSLVTSLGLVSAVQSPTLFTFANLVETSADLSWSLNEDNNDVIIAYALEDLYGTPENGSSYTTGDFLPDGSEIIYSGSADTFSYSGFSEGVTNYLRIWSVNGDVEYSATVKLSVKGLSADDLLYEDFESGAGNWTLGTGIRGTKWYIGSAESYKGNGAGYVTDDNGMTSSYDTDGINSIDMTVEVTIPPTYQSAELSFYWKAIGEGNYDGGSVRIDNVSVISSKELFGQDLWIERVVDLTDEIGNTFDLTFRWENDFRDGESPGLCVDEVRITGSEVARPQSFTGVATSSSEVALVWDKSLQGDDVVIAYSSYGTIGRPESGISYSVGDYLTGGGKVVYVGSGVEFAHTGSFDGTLTYSIWSDKENVYSSALTAEVQVPVSLPFTEDFENDARSWSFVNDGYVDEWVVASATAYGGSSSAYISNDKGINAAYDAVYAVTYSDVEVDLRGYTDATLSFWWKSDGNDNAYGRVYIGGDYVGGNYQDNTSWTEEIIDVSAYVGAIQTFRFRWYNNGQSGVVGFSVDNVYVTGEIENPVSFDIINSNSLYNDLVWAKNAFGDDVMVAWSADGTFGNPVEGQEYETGDEIVGGGTVLYIGGELLAEIHEPLKYGTIYHYKVWSSRNGIYSTGLISSANTPSKVTIVSENWEDNGDGYPEWTTNAPANYWLKGGTDVASGGSRSAYISNNGSTAGYVNTNSTATLDIIVNLDDLQSGNVSFDWMSEGESGNDYGEVYLNGTRISEVKEYQGNGTWSSEVIDIESFCDQGLGDIVLRFQWVNNNSTNTSPGFSIDNVEVGGIYAATSLVSNEMRLVTEVSSLVNSSVDGVSVYGFDLTDKTSLYGDITRIQQLVISKGAANDISDWSDALAGALLFGPDIDPAGMAGVITSASITFTGADMILLETQDVAETYSLKVWLSSDLNGAGVNDGDAFDFAVNSNDIVTGLGDDFVVDQVVESGSVEVAVTASELLFSQQPSAFATKDAVLEVVPQVAAVDANGNVDVDFGSDINLSNSGAIGMSPTSSTASTGIGVFSNLTFTGVGDVTLEATYSGLSSVTSDEISIENYCLPSRSGAVKYVNNVILNTLNNSSGDDGGYGSFLGQSIGLTIGVDYDITLGVFSASGVGNAHVWIDWDQSQTFDSDERIDIGTSSTTGSIEVIAGTVTVPADQDAVVGATRMRVQFLDDSQAANACVTGQSGESEDYVVVLATNSWKGSSNVWSVGQNWSSGSEPDSNSDIYIPEHPYFGDIFPVINGSASMKDLEIAQNASLTVSAGSQVSVAGDITNNGLVVIENTIDSPTSFINEGTITGSGEEQVDWTYLNDRYFYIGHSVDGTIFDDYNEVTSNTFSLYRYTGSWSRITSPADLTGNEYEMEGYAAKFQEAADVTVSYSGRLRYDVCSEEFSGWHLTANPYQAYLDVENAGFELGTAMTTIWTATMASGELAFATYNTFSHIGANGGTQYIAPGQSFWVRNYGTSTVSIDPSVRTHQTGSLKSSSIPSGDILRLELSNEGVSDEVVIALRAGGALGVTNYDSEKRLGNGVTVPNIYAKKENSKVVIGLYPEVAYVDSIELGYKFTSVKEVSLKATNIEEFMVADEVLLLDRTTGEIIDLKEVPEYTFTSNGSEETDRFVLLFGHSSQISTGIDSSEEIETTKSQVEIFGGEIATVDIDRDLLVGEDALIEVYSLSGQKVMGTVTNESLNQFSIDGSSSVYIVKVMINGQVYSQKVVIKDDF